MHCRDPRSRSAVPRYDRGWFDMPHKLGLGIEIDGMALAKYGRGYPLEVAPVQ